MGIRGDKLEALMDEEENLIKERQFALTMMSCCDDIIREAEKVEYTKISDQFKKEKEDYHQKWKEANIRLKQIDREIGELS